jgi:hypothetical protein
LDALLVADCCAKLACESRFGSWGAEGVATVPLSEDEQRILSQIEQQLYETDPSLARGIADTTVYSDAYRQLKRGVLAFALGLVVMIGTLHLGARYAAIGVVIMFLSGLSIVANGRRMGRAGIDQLAESMRAAGLRDYFGNRTTRMRDRFRKDEN